MTTTDERTTTVDLERVQAFAAQVGSEQAVSINSVLAYLGDRLGIWRALASVPSATPVELAERTGLAERYLREWLAAQAAAGYLEYRAESGSYVLPAEHAAVLAEDDSLAALAGGFEFLAAVWSGVDGLAHAFATGEGIGWHTHDSRLFSAVDRNFRPLYAASLVDQWLPALDGVLDKLHAGARVLDIGCGLGTPTIMMAQAFPNSTFVGVDNHDESIRRAGYAAAKAGVTDRVTFRQTDGAELGGEEYDLICYFDALHDFGDPVGSLRAARGALAQDGTVMAIEPLAQDRVEDNLHPIGLMWYASSAMVCVPGSLSQPGAAALGAQAGPARIAAAFHEAGFSTARTAATGPMNIVIEGRR